jgi:hypothetical protein
MEAPPVRPVAIGIGIAVVAMLGLLFVWGVSPGTTVSLPPGITEVNEPSELQTLVEVTRLGILTSSNYLGQKVYIVRATLKNVSDKPVRFIDVKLTFLDDDKKMIHEEIRTAFSLKQKPLEPGTEYRAEIAFENPPGKWNYHVPETKVVKAAY